MKNRTECLQIARHKLFDLLVIGGGLVGSAVAQDAASRGLSVALVEKEDFSSGSSSKTAQILHGGLRHLSKLNVNLSIQSCREQDLLQKLAPHLVRKISCVLPLSEKDRLFNFKAKLGMTIYDTLSAFARAPHRHSALSTNSVKRAAPALSDEDLAGGLQFAECVTDDTRLVMAVLQSACEHGAIAVNYLQAKSFWLEGARIQGVHCRDRYTGEDLLIRADSCINATGVWADDICRLVEPSFNSGRTLSKCTYITVPASALEINTALLLPTSNGNCVFVVPWQHVLLIGSTERPYLGSPDAPLPERDEIDHLLAVVNSYCSGKRLTRDDIMGSFSGLRPRLPKAPVAPIANGALLPPDTKVTESSSGMVTVFCGELESYRLVAKHAVDMVVGWLPEAKIGNSKTDSLMLGGWNDKQNYVTLSSEISMHARKLQLDPATIEHLIECYGAEAAAIMGLIERDSALGNRISNNYAPIMAEVVYTVQQEMALSLEDVLYRRLRLGLLNPNETMIIASRVAKIMQRLLDWDTNRLQAELSALEMQIGQHREPICREQMVMS